MAIKAKLGGCEETFEGLPKLGLRISGLGFPMIRGTFREGPRNKDYRILGVYIGVPLFREITIWNKCPSRANYMVSLQWQLNLSAC